MTTSHAELKIESDVYITNPVTKAYQEFYSVSIVDVAKAFISDAEDSTNTFLTRVYHLLDSEKKELNEWIRNHYADYINEKRDLASNTNVRERIFLLYMQERDIGFSYGLKKAVAGYQELSTTEPLANYFLGNLFSSPLWCMFLDIKFDETYATAWNYL